MKKTETTDLNKVLTDAKIKVVELELLVDVIKRLQERMEDDWEFYRTEKIPTGKMKNQTKWNYETHKYEDVIDPGTGGILQEEGIGYRKVPLAEDELGEDAQIRRAAYLLALDNLKTLVE